MKDVRELAAELVGIESVTPRDNGCQALVNEQLEDAGFTVEDFSTGPATNTFAFKEGVADGPSVILAGHTDVVGVKDQQWRTDPFDLTEKDGRLFGRGIVDMKGGLASLACAAARFAAENPRFSGNLGFVMTSFEEIADDPELDIDALGMNHVVERINAMGYPADYVVLGEPASLEKPGDTIKNGRRGVLDVTLEVNGSGGHTAYINPASNPLMVGASAIGALAEHTWAPSEGNFPDTMLNFATVEGANVKANVPGHVAFFGNARFGLPYTSTEMARDVTTAINDNMLAALQRLPAEARTAIDWDLAFNVGGEPFITPEDSPLIGAARAALNEVAGIGEASLSTAGGTSDGRYLATLKGRSGNPAHTIEIGPVGTTLHQADESIAVGELELFEDVYRALLGKLLLAED